MLIGISTYVETARHDVWDEVAALVPYAYVEAVVGVGGCPVLLPPSLCRPEALLSGLDGLVIAGGRDLNPRTYGAAPHHETDPSGDVRDAWEMALCRAALGGDLPLLGVCRGLQVINVVLGGTLHQHLPDVLGHDDHRVVRGQKTWTRVMLSPGSAVADILGPEVRGLCSHHQAIDRLGQGVQAVGFAADGTVEAVQVLGKHFALGVQWHPEDDRTDRRLFEAYAEAAGRYAWGRSSRR